MGGKSFIGFSAFIYALLIGSVIVSTDPSVLVPLFKNMRISNKLKQTIISESAFNDASAAIMTFSILGIIAGGKFSIGASIFELLVKAGGGIIVGLIMGYISVSLVSVIFDRKAKWNYREVLYLMWTKETGVIPAALAGMLASMKIPNAELISAVTFMAIIVTLLLQASTALLLAKKLKLDA